MICLRFARKYSNICTYTLRSKLSLCLYLYLSLTLRANLKWFTKVRKRLVLSGNDDGGGGGGGDADGIGHEMNYMTFGVLETKKGLKISPNFHVVTENALFHKISNTMKFIRTKESWKLFSLSFFCFSLFETYFFVAIVYLCESMHGRYIIRHVLYIYSKWMIEQKKEHSMAYA